MLYAGEAIEGAMVRLVRADPDTAAGCETGEADDGGLWSRWIERGGVDEAILYFTVEYDGAPVGEIFLHDIDLTARHAYVGYRIYDEAQRGRGLGRAALAVLALWTTDQSPVDRLYAIAKADNVASCRIAQLCGFEFVGTAREDPNRNVYRLELTRP